MTPALALDDVGFGFPGRKVLEGVSFAIAPGEFVVVLGPSGGGKSTLLRLVAGLLEPSSGQLRIAGAEVRGPRRDVGMVFQKPTLLPWRTALDNVLLPAGFSRGASATERARAQELLAAVGLPDAASLYPAQLSGGMAQRVGLARMLLHDPDLLLLDEPFAALDAMTRERMTLLLQELWLSRPRAALFVTHSIPEALLLADRVIVLAGRPGRIQVDWRVDLPRPRRPETMADPAFNEMALALRREFDLVAA
ncbi:ABC transporter ATP-binding protein [Sabulicella rubraurantiaca]|uniref:ABC transporter ATP-binding protein n=1 Tax=Sabulicella rubraurantiaca TaxID=2811429 RepID=UPI001A97A33F|nr:ABC transporter ATP-binding protein [Sabulicella rubraurantiaca]